MNLPIKFGLFILGGGRVFPNRLYSLNRFTRLRRTLEPNVDLVRWNEIQREHVVITVPPDNLIDQHLYTRNT